MAIASLESRGATGPDPGAVDNRLSLDPNDRRWKKMLSKWEDGGRYAITIGGKKLQMDQLSPGEFEIVGGEPEPMEEEAAPESRPRLNRAVRGMMEEY